MGSVAVVHGSSCSEACGIFLDQGLNPCPLHWQVDSYPLCHQGSLAGKFWGRIHKDWEENLGVEVMGVSPFWLWWCFTDVYSGPLNLSLHGSICLFNSKFYSTTPMHDWLNPQMGNHGHGESTISYWCFSTEWKVSTWTPVLFRVNLYICQNWSNCTS